jgi:aminoglycoside/choline kinase family phosphotransferase
MTSTSPSIAWPDESRRHAFEAWLQGLRASHDLDPRTLRPASADASFRRYFRVDGSAGSFVVMDAPPPQEDVRPFVRVASLLHDAGLHAPRVLEQDAHQGFLLLSDLGEQPYLQTLRAARPEQADALMREAINALVSMQAKADASALPPYDEALLQREMALFPEWCVQREHGLSWSASQRSQWDALTRRLVASALAQPTVTVHRDYMPRNLMVSSPNPGILDFQDAVRGPITYDIASLLRDAFISWDEEREIDWAVRYWEAARAAGLPVDADFSEFWRALEWMGLQRHLKVLGIFCRLKHRDGKAAYVADLPRFFGYATKVAMRYGELAPLLPLIGPMTGAAVQAGYTF